MTKEIINNSFNKLEQARSRLSSQLENIDNEKLNAFPAGDKWSIAQICHHLILSERLSLIYIKKKLHYKTNIKNTNFVSALRLLLLKTAFTSPFSFKAPTNVANPPEHSSLAEISEDWEKVRMDMKKIIEELPNEFLTGNIFKHPLAGKMNLNHAIEFFIFHFNHHRKQIERLLE